MKKYDNSKGIVFNTEILKGTMIRKNLTQRRLAELIGVNEATVSKYLHGENAPNFKTLVRILDVLNLELEDVVIRKEEVK